jgi:multidrug efflux pump subunit AcrB
MRPIALLLVFTCGSAAQAQSSILIEASAPGCSPRVAEQTVLAPLEQNLDGMDGIQGIRGLALDGRCIVKADLMAGADPQLVLMMLRKRVALTQTALPAGCTTEILPPADAAFMVLALEPAPNMTLVEVTQKAKKTVWPILADVPGIVNIQLLGSTEKRARITLDLDRLRAHNLTAGDVAAAVQGAVFDFDNLSVHGDKVTLKNKTKTLEDLKNLPIPSGKEVYLRDVATVKLTEELTQDARMFGHRADDFSMRRVVLVLVQLASGNLAREQAGKAVAKIRTTIPDGMRCWAEVLQVDNTTAIVMRLPDGIGSERGLEKAEAAVKALMQLPQVDTAYWIARPNDPEVTFYVLAYDAKPADLQKSLRAKLAGIAGTTSRVGGLYAPLVPWPGQGSQFVALLQGQDLEKLQKTAEQLRARLAKTPGIVDIDHFPKMRQETDIEINREKMGLAGLQMADLVKELHFQDQPITGWPWPVTLAHPAPAANKPLTNEDLGAMSLRTHTGEVVLLRDVAVIRTITAPRGVLHEGGRPCVMVFGNIEGRNREEAGADIRRIARELAGNGVDIAVEK